MIVTHILHTDVLVVGGTTAAVDFAISQQKHGRHVLLITGFTYFGEEQCATLTCGDQTPMTVKRNLDQKIIKNNIDFRFRSWPLKLSGNTLFFGNSEGIFAVQTSAIVDFTREAIVAHMSKMPFVAFQPGDKAFTRTVLDADRKPKTLTGTVTVKDDSITSRERAEVEARQQTWSDQNLFTADFCDIDLFTQAAGTDPAQLVYLPQQVPASLPIKTFTPDTKLELGDLPTLKSVDVLVVGAGTAGAPAGIAAGRNGAKTLLIEELAHPGGLGTEGRIARYWFGLTCGFTKEVDAEVQKLETGPHAQPDTIGWSVECKQYYWERELLKAKADIWYQYTCCGCLCEDGKVTTAIVAGPYGAGLVKTKQIIDATGNANIASFAGAPTVYADEDEPAVQGAGMSLALPERPYMNTDYMFTVDASNQDTARAFIVGRDRNKDGFDLVKIPGTRERRRIVGEIVLQPTDFFKDRNYPDTIYMARSNFDTHGFTVHPFLLFQPTDEAPKTVQVPMRALLCPSLRNLLTTGLGVSAHRDAMPLIRMQADVQNQGYAAGLVATMAVQQNKELRDLDTKEIQQRLVKLDILPAKVLEGDIADQEADDENAKIFDHPDFDALRADFSQAPDCQKATRLALLGDDTGKELLQDTLRNATWDQGWNYRGMGQFGMSASRLDVAIMALARISDDAAPLTNLLAQLKADSEFSHIRACCYFLMKHPCEDCAEALDQLLNQFPCHAIRELPGILGYPETSDTDITERNAQLKELYLAGALRTCDPNNPTALTDLLFYQDGVHKFFAIYADKFMRLKTC